MHSNQEALKIIWSLGISALVALSAFCRLEAAEIKVSRLTFEVATNVKLFSFVGQAEESSGKVTLRGQELQALEVRLPVASLHSALEMRDRHMRERIFARSDGSQPDLVFSASQARCKPAPSSEGDCVTHGMLSIRGEPRPLDVTFKRGAGGQILGESLVKLSDYGIAAPSHAGITVDDRIKIHFEGRLQ